MMKTDGIFTPPFMVPIIVKQSTSSNVLQSAILARVTTLTLALFLSLEAVGQFGTAVLKLPVAVIKLVFDKMDRPILSRTFSAQAIRKHLSNSILLTEATVLDIWPILINPKNALAGLQRLGIDPKSNRWQQLKKWVFTHRVELVAGMGFLMTVAAFSSRKNVDKPTIDPSSFDPKSQCPISLPFQHEVCTFEQEPRGITYRDIESVCPFFEKTDKLQSKGSLNEKIYVKKAKDLINLFNKAIGEYAEFFSGKRSIINRLSQILIDLGPKPPEGDKLKVYKCIQAAERVLAYETFSEDEAAITDPDQTHRLLCYGLKVKSHQVGMPNSDIVKGYLEINKEAIKQQESVKIKMPGAKGFYEYHFCTPWRKEYANDWWTQDELEELVDKKKLMAAVVTPPREFSPTAPGRLLRGEGPSAG